jgi:hypothetical protein
VDAGALELDELSLEAAGFDSDDLVSEAGLLSDEPESELDALLLDA